MNPKELQKLKAFLAQLYPDGEIPWDQLQEALESESYRLAWKGRAAAARSAWGPAGIRLPELGDADTLIEAENLAALHALSQCMEGKISAIYIDPPYNTGKDFTYKDNFRKGRKGQLKGRHDQWLSMLYPRLAVARRLLKDTGVIFVSIGDTELPNLRILMEEVFGPENVIGIFCWVKKRKGSHLSSTLRSLTEYVVCAAKDRRKTNLYGEKAYSDKWQPLMKKRNARKKLRFPGGCVETKLEDGVYGRSRTAANPFLSFEEPLEVHSGIISNGFVVEGPFVWTQRMLDGELEKGTRASLSKRFGFNVLRHDQKSKFKRPTTLLNGAAGIGTYEDAFAELSRRLDGEFRFSYAKPVSLVKYLLRAATHFEKDAIVLDFFAGSGTTGEAVWQLNAEDGGSRRFILVQEAAPTGDSRYPTICDMAWARLEAAAKEINPEAKLLRVPLL
jgi:adenine-specific DNA-methyltransferase